MKNGPSLHFILFAALSLSACSNPFAGKSAPQPSFHSANRNCQNLKLDSDRFDSNQLRTMVHCLNTDGQIQELENVLSEIPDEDLSAMSEVINRLLKADVRTLFAVQTAYEKLKLNGRIPPLFQQVKQLDSIAALTPAADLISAGLFDPSLKFNISHARVYLGSAAFKRLIQEHRGKGVLEKSVRLLDQYLAGSKPDRRLKGLQILLRQSGIELPKQVKTLEPIASFFEGVYAKRHFAGLSTTLESIREKPIYCFNRSFTPTNPLANAIHTVSRLSAREARTFFDSTLRTLALTARDYCSIPYSLQPLLRFTDELIALNSFDLTYRFLLPLLKKDWFVQHLSEPATREWIEGSAYLASQHAVQDAFALVALNESFPLTDAPDVAAAYLDRAFEVLTPQQLVELSALAEPFFRDLTLTPLLDIHHDLPEFEMSLDPTMRARMAKFTLAFLRAKNFPALLPMVQRLIDRDQVLPLWDQIFEFFQETVQKGRHPLKFAKARPETPSAQSLKKLLLNKLNEPPTPSACRQVDSDLSFTHPAFWKSATWLALDACIGTTPGSRAAVQSAKALVEELRGRGQLDVVAKLQSDLIQGAFKVDLKSSLDLVTHFTQIKDQTSAAIRKGLLLGSSAAKLFSPTLLKMPRLRALFADAVQDAALYRGLIELDRHPEQKMRETPFALSPTSTFDTWTAAGKMQTLPFARGLQALMNEYCPSLNIHDKDCDVDADQVELYRTHPERLAQEIIDESVGRSNTWIHPRLNLNWDHQGAGEVQDFKSHYYPMLHEFRANMEMGNSIFDFFSSYQGKIADLKSFIHDNGSHYSLIPYIYQLPGYPKSSKKEFHSRIRLRLVSDLDRLELIAINADFKPLGLGPNLAMKFIRQIGLAWGDEPAHLRPPQTTSQTLSEATAEIQNEIGKFDRDLLQKLGQCDSRGKSRVGRWLQQSLCSEEIVGMSARVFNTRFLSPLFDIMQVGGQGNGSLRLLRNLFYSLHISNSESQKGKFGNGLALAPECFAAPTQAKTPSKCQLDQLTLISRVTRLGLLHQAGVSASFTPGSSVDLTLETLVKVGGNSKLRKQIAAWLITPQSSTMLISLEDWLDSLPASTTAAAIHPILKMAAALEPFHWISSLVTAFEREPLLIRKLASPLSYLATLPPSPPSTLIFERSPHLLRWVKGRLQQIDDGAQAELAHFFQSLGDQPQALKSVLVQAHELPELNSPTLTKDLNAWLVQFATPASAPSRAALKQFVLSRDFDAFCDVYSDSSLVTRTYNFLEKIHQNPDSENFFDTCKTFLFR